MTSVGDLSAAMGRAEVLGVGQIHLDENGRPTTFAPPGTTWQGPRPGIGFGEAFQLAMTNPQSALQSAIGQSSTEVPTGSGVTKDVKEFRDTVATTTDTLDRFGEALDRASGKLAGVRGDGAKLTPHARDRSQGRRSPAGAGEQRWSELPATRADREYRSRQDGGR